MSQVRFATVQDMFDTYPTARRDVGKSEPDARSLEFLRELIARKDWEPAVSFCAYLLPRRAAIGWGCRSLRRMVGTFNAADDKALHFAESWFADPDENWRRKALAIGNANDTSAPATWLALATGWSGGSIVPPEFGQASAAPEQTARAVKIALVAALSTMNDDVTDKIMPACLEDGIQAAIVGPAATR